MTLYYKSWENDNYLYAINIIFSENKLSLLPMVYVELYINNGFRIKLGFLTLFIEFVKLHKMSTEKIKELFNNLLLDKLWTTTN